MAKVYVVAILSLVTMFFCFGYLGPKRLREKMHKFNRWYFHGSSLWLPMQPDKPIFSSIKEGTHEFWPSKERLRQVFHYAAVILAAVAISTIISVVIAALVGY